MVKIKPINLKGEIYNTKSPSDFSLADGSLQYGIYYWGDVLDVLSTIKTRYEGRIQLIYMDPPFVTGQSFHFQQKFGEKGWTGDRNYIIDHTAYQDMKTKDRQIFLNIMRDVLKYAYEMLSPEGSIYLHIDYRTSSYMRIILDDIFGEKNFLNEIIWHYKSGGRAKKYYSRKHDTILFYSKTKDYYFDIDSVGVKRGPYRRNHMKQGIDEQGRIFWTIRSAGKEYRYYQDSKVYPSDVWDDISHLQQRDPERTGYDTQKPEALLERIILASSKPGDLVADFFTGSGTAMAVAKKNNRNFLGIDKSNFSLLTCRKRLLTVEGAIPLKFIYYSNNVNTYESTNDCENKPRIDLCSEIDEHIIKFQIKSYYANIPSYYDKRSFFNSVDEFNILDYWAVGYIENGYFIKKDSAFRNEKCPILKKALSVDFDPKYKYAVHFVDVFGRQYFYAILL